VTAGNLVRHGSRGIYSPSTEQIGRRMSNPTGTSNVADIRKAVNSYDKEMKRKGYKPLHYRPFGRFNSDYTRIYAGAGRQALLGAIKREEAVHVVVTYAQLRQASKWYARWTAFQGGHSFTVGGKRGWKKKKNRVYVRLNDSIAKRIQWIPFSVLWQAADGAWSKRGGRGWVGGSVKCAAKLPVPPGQTEPAPDPVEEALVEARARVGELETSLAEAQDLIEALKGRRLPAAIKADLAELAAEIASYVEPADVGQVPQDGVGDIEA